MIDLTQQVAHLPSVDAEYRFGKPKTYLTARELARLILLRSRLGDTQRERAAESPPMSGLRRAASHSYKQWMPRPAAPDRTRMYRTSV
jgi:hypothetical protein